MSHLNKEALKARAILIDTLEEAKTKPSVFAKEILHFEPYDYNVDYLDCMADRILYRAGRKVGKTQNTAAKALHFAWYAKETRPDVIDDICDILIVAPTKAQSDIMFGMIKRLAHRDPMFESSILKETSDELWLAWINGEGYSRIFTRASGDRGDSLRGYVPHLIIVDEAAFVRYDVFNALMPSGLSTKAHWWFTSTPFGKQGYFYDMCMLSKPMNDGAKSACSDDPKARWKQFHASSLQNPVPDDAYFEELKLATRDQYTQEVLGEFLSLGDALIARDLITQAMKPMGRLPNTVRYAMGIDVAGRGLDETVISVIAYDPKYNRVWLMETVSIARSTLLEVADKVYDTYMKYGTFIDGCWMDVTGLGQGALDNAMAKGVPVRGVDFLNKEKVEMYTTVVHLFEHGKICLNENEKMASQLGYLKTAKTEGNRLKIESEKSDDYPDSLALACRAVHAGQEWQVLTDDKGKALDFGKILEGGGRRRKGYNRRRGWL